MNVAAWALAAGALAGTGATLLVRELLPAHPDLADALDRIHPTDTTAFIATPAAPTGAVGVLARLADAAGDRLAEWTRGSRWVSLPAKELALLGRSPQRFLLTKAALAALGLVFAQLLAAAMGTIGLRLPFPIPAAASLALAAVLFLVPDLDVRAKAGQARREFRRAVCAYLDLVALERAGDAGVVEALERAAGIGQGWAFSRIRDALTRARLSGHTPWDGLAALADDVGVPELGDVADIMRLSGEDGAAVYDTLRARAAGLRATVLTEQEAAANADSEKMIAPVAFLGIVFIALLGYPAFARIMFG